MPKNVVVVGMQWGDEGKGKIVDILSEYADIVVRFQGGNNAGHTVIRGGEKFILHLMPSGVLSQDKTCVIGGGVVVDPQILLEEIDGLRHKGYLQTDSNFLISNEAHLIMPYHKKLDILKERIKGDSKIGTTGRGIGPAYEDKVARCGIRCKDLMDDHVFREKLKVNLMEKNYILSSIYHDQGFEISEIYYNYVEYGKRLGKYITDTSLFLNNAIKEGKQILFEGAQGTLLDVDYGTYPFVTSSNTIAGAASTGSGVGPTKIGSVIGITKAYTTRVGEGPFPTETKGKEDEMLRQRGGEFGATTGRARRCGWFDNVSAKYAVRVNGVDGLVITKLDVLDALKHIPICIAYSYKGKRLEEYPADSHILSECEPIYETVEGWLSSTKDVKNFDELPKNAKAYIRRIEELTGIEAVMLSVGANREDAILLKNPFL